MPFIDVGEHFFLGGMKVQICLASKMLVLVTVTAVCAMVLVAAAQMQQALLFSCFGFRECSMKHVTRLMQLSRWQPVTLW